MYRVGLVQSTGHPSDLDKEVFQVFIRNGWTVGSSYSLYYALLAKPDVLVIATSEGIFVREYVAAGVKIPTVWVCFGANYTVPEGAEWMLAPVLPSDLFAKCQQLLRNSRL